MNKSIKKLVLLSSSFLIVAVGIFAMSSNQSESFINKTKLESSQNGIEIAALESNLMDMGIYSYDGGSKCGEGKCGEGTSKEKAKESKKEETSKESTKESKKESKSAKPEKSTKKAETKCGAGKCGGGNE